MSKFSNLLDIRKHSYNTIFQHSFISYLRFSDVIPSYPPSCSKIDDAIFANLAMQVLFPFF